ncbi:MAG: hypothetical protein M3O35_11950 [Acidobacteriota bacterium]|nr:hypothetical protein [Acidobacteriota bacterium]
MRRISLAVLNDYTLRRYDYYNASGGLAGGVRTPPDGAPGGILLTQ